MKISTFVLMLLGAAGWLMADIPDPTIRLSIPGGGSPVIDCGDGCVTSLGLIGEDGFATLDFRNGSNQTMGELKFFIPTTNFNQLFSASNNSFKFAQITLDTSGVQYPGDGSTPEIVVDFSGIGPADQGGSASTSGEGCFGNDSFCNQLGFTPGGEVFVETFFADPAGGDCCPGLPPNGDASLQLAPDVPEPGSFILVASAAGFLAVSRKFKFRRT